MDREQGLFQLLIRILYVERKIMRRMYGPLRENERCNIRTKKFKIYFREDIERIVKSWRLALLGHVERMGEECIPKMLLK